MTVLIESDRGAKLWSGDLPASPRVFEMVIIDGTPYRVGQVRWPLPVGSGPADVVVVVGHMTMYGDPPPANPPPDPGPAPELPFPKPAMGPPHPRRRR